MLTWVFLSFDFCICVRVLCSPGQIPLQITTVFWLSLSVTLLFHIQTDKLLESGNLSHHVWLEHVCFMAYFSLCKVWSSDSWLRFESDWSLFLDFIVITCDSTQTWSDDSSSQTDIVAFWVSLISHVYICQLLETFWAKLGKTVSSTQIKPTQLEQEWDFWEIWWSTTRTVWLVRSLCLVHENDVFTVQVYKVKCTPPQISHG